LAGVALIVAATALTKAADVISDRTKIGRVWIGAVLLAGATSLPELATDVSAVRMNAADLAAGDLFGSSMANMLILAVIDLLPPRRRVLRGAGFENLLAASLAIVLTAVAAVFVLTRPQHQVLGLAPESFVLLGVYFFGMRAIYRHGARAHEHSKAVKAPAATMTTGTGPVAATPLPGRFSQAWLLGAGARTGVSVGGRGRDAALRCGRGRRWP